MGPFLLVLNFLAGLCFCLFARVFSDKDTQEHINMKRGDDCTLQTGTVRRSSMIILWSFIRPTTDNDLHIAQLYKDNAEIMPTDQFRNRLHLDRHTGSLTVTDIGFMDSGLYKLNIRGGTQNSYKEFDVIVYGDVGVPMVTVYHSKTKLDRNCSVECSVENGREVTLSWYRGNDLLNQTSSPDLNMTLRVPLEVERHDNSIYSCVAANPVSNQTIFLNITATCSAPLATVCSTCPPSPSLPPIYKPGDPVPEIFPDSKLDVCNGLDDLDFADDLALVSHSQQWMQEKTSTAAANSTHLGLNIHKGKSKVLKVNTNNTKPILLEGEALDELNNFTYLGSIVNKQGGADTDVRQRGTLATHKPNDLLTKKLFNSAGDGQGIPFANLRRTSPDSLYHGTWKGKERGRPRNTPNIISRGDSHPNTRTITGPESRALSRPESQSSSSCQVLCSVKNDREVSLSWFRGNDILNQTSSPDASITLSLPLDIDDQEDTVTYRCVSANPASNYTTHLDIPAVCPYKNQKVTS
ncbi:uncharacterized protein LOC134099491 [Sardina pilchardus]|uniref:uncharacterized protein LOC134099491 n=1 Tax=Sardina pilchardus TaxID=27697 RepID=UPI002E0E1294